MLQHVSGLYFRVYSEWRIASPSLRRRIGRLLRQSLCRQRMHWVLSQALQKTLKCEIPPRISRILKDCIEVNSPSVASQDRTSTAIEQLFSMVVTRIGLGLGAPQ